MPEPEWTNSYAKLPDDFYSRVNPTPFETQTSWVHVNKALIQTLGLSGKMADNTLLDWLSGQRLPQGSEPLAMLYAGHQFGHYVPQLGDGRAIMLGEVSHQDNKWEIQLKGSGLTPYSRSGDGRAVLRSTIREYLCSEAMYGLGIPTTRALAMVRSNDEVYRERIEPGAILTRIAESHIRFGSFEVFFYRNQFKQIKELADYMISHHYPQLQDADHPYLALLEEVMQRTAMLIAKWQAVGFAHGVLNSDNMSILGLTLDYGPFGFMEAYNPAYICNHSDHTGRYAFNQQPQIGLFNLSCLAQALLPLFDETPEKGAEQAREILADYQPSFVENYAEQMRHKLGFVESHVEDQALLTDLLNLMAEDSVDYTILFRRLADFVMNNPTGNIVRDLFIQREQFDSWAKRYAQRLTKEQSVDSTRKKRMNSINPKFILRNYLAEMAIRKAEDEHDYSFVDTLFQILQNPFAEWPEHENLATHPPDWAQQISVSCSS